MGSIPIARSTSPALHRPTCTTLPIIPGRWLPCDLGASLLQRLLLRRAHPNTRNRSNRSLTALNQRVRQHSGRGIMPLEEWMASARNWQPPTRVCCRKRHASQREGRWRWCGWRGSNPRPSASEADTLSTELQPLAVLTSNEFVHWIKMTWQDSISGIAIISGL